MVYTQLIIRYVLCRGIMCNAIGSLSNLLSVHIHFERQAKVTHGLKKWYIFLLDETLEMFGVLIF